MADADKKNPSKNQPVILCCRVRTALLVIAVIGFTGSIVLTILSEHFRVLSGFTLFFYFFMFIGAFFHFKFCLSTAQKFNVACLAMHLVLSMTSYGWKLYFELILISSAVKIYEYILVRRLIIYISSVKNIGRVHPPV